MRPRPLLLSVSSRLGLGLLSLLTLGCGTLAGGRGWGQDATVWPGTERLGTAAKDAALDPWTWVPAAGAAFLQIDDFDERISDWAVDRNRVFGSAEDAEEASDDLRDSLFYAAAAVSVAANSGEDPVDWTTSKLKGGAVGFAAFQATANSVSVLKDLSKRSRPVGSNERSFPSRHAAMAFGYYRWASNNLDATSMPEKLKLPTRVVLAGAAFANGWARIESGQHFPSDVLAGAALGNFLTSFVQDAFLGLPPTLEVTAGVDPGEEAYVVGLEWRP